METDGMRLSLTVASISTESWPAGSSEDSDSWLSMYSKPAIVGTGIASNPVVCRTTAPFAFMARL